MPRASSTVQRSTVPQISTSLPRRYATSPRGFVKVPLATYRSPIPAGPLATLMWLGNYVRATQWRSHRPVDAVHPGPDVVAYGRGINERTARRHLAVLVDLGLLQLVTRGGRGLVTREGHASKVSRRAPKRITLAGGRVRYAQALANAYTVSALGWAAVQGGSLPDSMAERVPQDGRRKAVKERRVSRLTGGHIAPPDDSRMESDLKVLSKPCAAAHPAPLPPVATERPAKAAPPARATPSTTTSNGALGRKADRPSTARPSALGGAVHATLARLQREDAGAPPLSTATTRPAPASVLRAADPPPPRATAPAAPARGTPAYYAAIAARACARMGAPAPSTSTRDPAPGPRDPGWSALSEELARRGGER